MADFRSAAEGDWKQGGERRFPRVQIDSRQRKEDVMNELNFLRELLAHIGGLEEDEGLPRYRKEALSAYRARVYLQFKAVEAEMLEKWTSTCR